MSDTLEDVLAHYGVKGMKWGVRRSKRQLDSDSPDAARAKATRAKIKTNRGRTDSLSNQDLRDLVQRMNLEQQYSQLSANRASFGKRFVTGVLKNVGTQQATSVLNEQATNLRKR
jgi:hypothetical protein